MQQAAPRVTISKLDVEITGVTRELRKRERIDRLSSASWQAAWDKHPDLHTRHSDLYRQRGEAQLQYAEQEAVRATMRARSAMPARAKPCSHCRGTGRATLA